ncbi:chemotaxis protein CheW [Methylocapsa palsarum]|uniref:Chemotaxis protein CheW n=1 Tax=Methylocapsa palsarum TaxID=1612308 RepID=A0A1I4CTB8_9HYPH|nr:chemotaxis protein CheW [Methylocapsa palsarum]SFK84544.1 purine-binding chemotaxis protein CheW [Methylocapsa palsarum]
MNSAGTREASNSAKRRFLVFRVAQRIYALPAEAVDEVIRIPLAARVPQAPKALIGVANLRGVVLPIASLRAMLGLGEVEENAASRAIVLDGGAPVAIVVDAIDALITVEAERLETQAAQLSVEQGERLSGAFALGDDQGAAKILDVQSLLAESFARRIRPNSNPLRSVAATSPPEAAAERETLVTFDVAGQEFALDLGVVREIISLPDAIAAAPHAEAAVAGIIAFRGLLLPLLSMRELLGFSPAPASEIREKIIVACVGGALIGLLADRARAVIAADPRLIDPVPAVIQARSAGEARIKSIYRGEEGQRLVSILAPEQLFRSDVMRQLGEVHNPTRPQAQADLGREERKFLVFRLGDDEFGLPVEAVDEVARAPDRVTRVPRAPKFLEGVVNLRGVVIPVVDQRRRFDMRSLEQGDGRRLIVVRTGRHRAGLIVDSVSEVLRTMAVDIEAAPDLTEDIARLVHGVVNIEAEGRIILVLDPAELLTRAERGLLDKFESSARGSL